VIFENSVIYITLQEAIIGQTFDLEVKKLVYGGFGLCVYQDKTILIPKVLPGEQVRTLIKRKKKKVYLGELKEIISYPKNSPRKEASCFHFLECGGCAYQELLYSDQLKYKKQILEEIFENRLPIKKIVNSPSEYFYRNKCEFSFGESQFDQKLELGLHPLGRFDQVLSQKECFLLPQLVWEVLSQIRILARKTNLKVFNDLSRTGFWSTVTIRYTDFPQKRLLVLFKIKDPQEKEFLNLCSEIKNNFVQEISGIFAMPAPRGTLELILGENNLKQEIDQTFFVYGIENFFQINLLVLKDFLRLIKNLVDQLKPDFVLDLFAGVGLIGIYLAKKLPQIKYILGAEADSEACKIAQKNVVINQISNYQNIYLNLYKGGWGDQLKQIIQKEFEARSPGKNYPEQLCLILDPPRAGITQKTIKQISKLIPQNIIYISCNPTTQKRDCDLLKSLNYRLKDLYLVDMFPQTMHIESVALLGLEIP